MSTYRTVLQQITPGILDPLFAEDRILRQRQTELGERLRGLQRQLGTEDPMFAEDRALRVKQTELGERLRALQGELGTGNVSATAEEMFAEDRALRLKQTELGERLHDLYGTPVLTEVAEVPHTSITKPVEMWNFKSIQNPAEYAMLKGWEADTNTWSSTQVAEFEKWDGAFDSVGTRPGKDVWAAIRERQTRLNGFDSEHLRAGTNPPHEKLVESSNNILERMKALEERNPGWGGQNPSAQDTAEATSIVRESDSLMREIDISAGKGYEFVTVRKL